MDDSYKQKKKISPKPKKGNSSTLREQWAKGGGSADIRTTTQLIEAICNKIELK